MSSVIGAIIQARIYKESPCGFFATGCTVGTGVAPISIWWQIPIWVLGALSECFCNVSAYELAYARAPPNMKSLVMALFLFTQALSSAIAEAVTPVLVDPKLIWPFVGTAVAGTVFAIVFYICYRHLDDEDDYRRLSSETAIDAKSEE